MWYSVATAQYAIVEDKVHITFSSLGDRDSKISFTIEGAEQFVIEFNKQIVKAKKARAKIIEEDINKTSDTIKRNQDYVERRKNDLQIVLNELSIEETVKS